MQEIGKLMMVVGSLFLVVGILLLFLPKIPYLGKLPGDIMIKRENWTFFFPITTSILLSLILTLILNLLKR